MTPDAFASLVDHLPGVVYRCDDSPHRALVTVGRPVVDLLGCTPEQLLTEPSRSWLDLVHPEDRAAVVAGTRAALAAGPADGSEAGPVHDLGYRVLHVDGSSRWVRDQFRAVTDAAGGCWLDGFVWDVDESVRTAQVLAQYRDRLEQAQRLARLGHWEWEVPAGRVVWSSVVHDIFGIPRDEPPEPSTFYRLVHPDDLDHVRAAEQQGRERGQYEVVHRIVRPDGGVRVVQERTRVECDERGEVVRFAGVTQDVTELAETQASLEASEARLQRVLRATNDGWWDADLRAGTLVLAPRWWAIHGYAPDELPVHLRLWHELLHPDDVAAVDAAEAEVFAARSPTFAYECRVVHKDGHAVPVRIRGIVEYDDYGEAVRASGATTDLTEERRVERMKSEFVASVSHELRTPLTSISGALALVAEGVAGALPERAAHLVRIAHANSQRLGLLIDDLLDVERLASDRMRFDLQIQPLLPLVEQAIQDNAAYAERHDVRLVLVADVDGDVLVRVDPQRLHQVLANYLSNAAKFSPPGEDVEVVVGRPAPATVRVAVVDHGPGVPDDFRDRIFDAFAQADASDGRQRGGTGLGLAITKGIVERLAGTVGFDSVVGRTAFHFDLPVHGDASGELRDDGWFGP